MRKHPGCSISKSVVKRDVGLTADDVFPGIRAAGVLHARTLYSIRVKYYESRYAQSKHHGLTPVACLRPLTITMPGIEVEAKYRVADFDAVRGRLTELGARPGVPVAQRDEYFAHPSRDFAETNEALRLRRIGDENRITYKGPLMDAATKTRREIELQIESGQEGAARMRELLQSLGFDSVATVSKTRQSFHLQRDHCDVEAALDSVDGLGVFVELETTGSEEDWQSARDTLLQLAAELDLAGSERRSYLELLLKQSAERTPENGVRSSIRDRENAD